MIGYTLRRLAQAVIVLLGLTVLVFVLEHMIPGSLARAILGPRASAGEIATFDRVNGLDRSVVSQYLTFLSHLLHGNLGYSYRLNQSVDSLVVHELPNDLILVGIALFFALAIAIPLGIAQAVRRNRALDHVATGVSFLLYSMPSYWLGLLLIATFAIGVHVFPPEAPQAASPAGVLADPRALTVALAAKEALHFLGQPEGELALAEAVVYIATAPKSNRVYEAWGRALAAAREHPAEGVPLHIRNAPTDLMKELGYGKGYEYAHAVPEAYTPQEYLPPVLKGTKFYDPSQFGFEKDVAKRIEWWEGLKKRAGGSVDSSPEAG